MEPPPFQESPRCDVCKCSFTTFRRRHHCRCCGKTLCHEHSSNQMILPQFGINSPVRVCAECFNNSSQSGNQVAKPSINGADQITDSVARLDIGTEAVPAVKPVVQGNPECKCGMPLCICEAPDPSIDSNMMQGKNVPSSSQSSTKPKKIDTVVKTRASSSSSKIVSTSNAGQAANGVSEKPKMDYDVTGEGLREAIKNDDSAAVKKLLQEGVDANYRDKQGMSLLHLAAVFNRTDIAFILIDNGASLEKRNAQGETPMDCAPATLQYKMREKIGQGN
ncbi:hypothetical protein MLD38_005880 [Melastoma candidum]|uniref:Uncharacterized protein n=1 Tax=Melastoma candidum TaxID=119954 RepID=A0ACB9RKP6_9MYRT|nr:hypothetical protein MLD38_005880 [Melastoma candidum]